MVGLITLVVLNPENNLETRTKVLFVITNDEYIRNYLDTNALRETSSRFDLSIAASDSLENKDLVLNLPEFVGFLSTETNQAKVLKFLFQISAWRHRAKSKTFFYRWLRWSGWADVSKDSGLLDFVKTFIRWFFSAVRSADGLRIPVLGSWVVFPLSSRLLKSQIKPNWKLRDLLRNGGYAAVVYPSSGYEPLSVEIARETKALGIPSLCLIDNWDNLSSKTVFWEKPSALGVWGEQAKTQATAIHGFSEDAITLVGTPRFEKYFDRKSIQASPREYAEPYILFVGSAMPFDEIAALKKVEDLLREIDSERTLRIVYRPHPQQQKRKTQSTFEEGDFERVVLDNQFVEASKYGINVPGTTNSFLAGNKFQPSLDRYPALLAGAQIVMGPLTTMLLEASLCLTPAIGLAYSDKIHFNTTLKYFTHFDGMEKLPGFRFCFSESNLGETLAEALQLGPIDEVESDEKTSYFIMKSDLPYAERLANLIEDSISQAMTPHNTKNVADSRTLFRGRHSRQRQRA